MSTARILVCDPVHEAGIKMLKDAGLLVILKMDIENDELMDVIGGYEAIIIRSRTKITAKVLAAATRLKFIARAGVGLDNIDLKEAERKQVKVINSPEASSNAVAELVVGFLISLARRMPQAVTSMKQGEWTKGQLNGFEIKGKTLGVLGFGRIGFMVAKKAKALGMKVLVYDIIIEKLMNYVEEVKAESVTFNELLSNSDFITIHVPLLPQTRHLIGEKEMRLMKRGAFLINAARGAIIDEAALEKALTSGRLSGAALDVFEYEPPKDAKLIGLRNLIATPHIGASTREAQIANSTIVAEKLIKLLKEG